VGIRRKLPVLLIELRLRERIRIRRARRAQRVGQNPEIEACFRIAGRLAQVRHE
jgi:hypothetical protein